MIKRISLQDSTKDCLKACSAIFLIILPPAIILACSDSKRIHNAGLFSIILVLCILYIIFGAYKLCNYIDKLDKERTRKAKEKRETEQKKLRLIEINKLKFEEFYGQCE